jgi:predicted transcriptional regulator
MVAIAIIERIVMTTIQVSSELKSRLDKIGGELQSGNGKRRTYEEIIEELIRCWEKKA